MGRAQKLAAGIAAVMMVSAISAPVSFAAENAFGIDEINWTDEDWASIAMTNDDTVETGAVIRTEADADSKAAGYLYRGAAAQVVEKGEDWTKVKSGRVSGYVKNEFLAYGDEARGLAAHYGTQGIVANWDDVNVYEDSHADAPVSAQVDDKTMMSMIQDNGHWITVQNGSHAAGYVSEEDVTRVLLVDTAVPADGEDDEDVPATMTAADVPAENAVGSASEYEQAGRREDASYDPAANSGSDESMYAGENSYSESDSSDESAYTDAASSGESDSSDESTYTDAASSGESDGSDESAYTDAASSGESDGSDESTYTDAASSGESDGSDESAYSDENSYSCDSTDVQALYDAYVKAQNSAMSCTSEEDAKTKAEAAVAAWNAYLAACGETTTQAGAETASSAGSAESYGTSDDSWTETDADWTTDDSCAETVSDETADDSCTATASDDTAGDSYTETAADETTDDSYEETVQTEAAQTTASTSGSNAYGNYSELDLLAAIIWCEAGNQSYDGMVAVGQVVMNRVASASFPNTVSEVLNQPGQFTPASAGTLQAALAAGVNSTCYAAAQDAMNGASPVPGYPLYFNTHSGSYKLGAHYFS